MDRSKFPFFVFEGIDGSGKSTQQERLARHLRHIGEDVVECRDPGSTAAGEAIRGLCLEHHGHTIGPRAEMLLYMAARAQLVDEIIRPQLESDCAVVCDRFLLSTVAYQGYGRGVDIASIWEVGRVATRGCMPALTLLLDLPVDLAVARRTGADDRIESRGREYLNRVREGFLTEAHRDAERIVVIDAARPADVVAADIAQRIDDWFQSDRTR